MVGTSIRQIKYGTNGSARLLTPLALCRKAAPITLMQTVSWSFPAISHLSSWCDARWIRNYNSPVSQLFSPRGEQPEQRILAYKQNNQLYSSISQILPLYRIWVEQNRFHSMKSLGVYCWYDKRPRCRCVEHGLEEYASFYTCQETYSTLGGLFWTYSPPGGKTMGLQGCPHFLNSLIQ